jgi:hypothetical protein
MNERIKELIDRATVPVIETNDYNGMAYETYQFSQELFAELIVRECAFVGRGIGGINVSDAIMKRFGVE